MEWSTVFASGALASVLSALISGGASIYLVGRKRDRERRQELWRDKKEEVQRLERWAGYLVEQLSGHAQNQDSADTLYEAFNEVEAVKHILRRHSELAQAIRDFVNTAGFILEEAQQEERRELRRELQEKYDILIDLCDNVLNQDRL